MLNKEVIFYALSCVMLSANLSHANDLNQTPVDSNAIDQKKVELSDLSKLLEITVGSGMYMPGMYIYDGVNQTTKQARATQQTRLGYYVSYEKLENKTFKLVRISDSRSPVTDFSNQEVLYFSTDLKFVEPDYRNFIPVKGKDEMLCWTGAGRNRDNNAMTDYNPCESSLTKKSGINLGDAAFTAVFTFGLSALAGTANRNVFVDKEMVISLIKATSTMETLREWITAKESDDKLLAYRSAFQNARTSIQIDAAVRQYSNDDPEALIPTALDRRERLKQEEAQQQIDAQQRIVLESQRRDRERAALNATIRKIGAHVCRSVQGTTRAQIGSSFGNAIYEAAESARIFAIEGYVEAFNENKLKVVVTSITAPRLHSQAGIDSLNELTPTFTKGLPVWQDFEAWRPCEN